MEGGALDKVGKNVMPAWTGKETYALLIVGDF